MQVYAGECMYRHANGVIRRLRLLNVSPAARRQEVASTLPAAKVWTATANLAAPIEQETVLSVVTAGPFFVSVRQ